MGKSYQVKWQTVEEGTWVYDGAIEGPVWILVADCDFWFEMAKHDGTLEPEKAPTLNADGEAYYVTFKPPTDPFWPDAGGFMTLEEAQAESRARLPSDVRWSDLGH